MSYSAAIASLLNMLETSDLLGVYKGYTTAPFNFASTASADPESGLIEISEPIGLRGTVIKQQFNFDQIGSQTLFLGRAFVLKNNEIQEAFFAASELGIELSKVINIWAVQCGAGVRKLGEISAAPRIYQSDRVAQSLRAITGSPDNCTTTSTNWCGEVVVSFNMEFTT